MQYNAIKKGAATGLMALMLATALPAPQAHAATMDELQAQISALLAQIAALQGQVSGGSASCTPFTADLTIGRSGGEVTRLQNFLISKGFVIPAGATGYFGEQTRSALAKFQAANGIAPAAGYFGTLTRTKVNTLCAPVTPSVPDNNNGGQIPSKEDPLKGEAAFERFDVKNGDDTNLEEGVKNAPIMNIEFNVEDGDARINRIDLGFRPSDANNEKDPWDTFSEVSIYDGNERIARINAGSESAWTEDAPQKGDYRLRASGLNWTVEEGDDVELTVKVSTQKSIKGANDGEVWSVFVPNDGIRGLDAARANVYVGDSADSVTIDIDEAGSNDELIVRRSDNDPDATTLQLKDNAKSGWITVFAFDLDTDDSENDIMIRKIPVALTVGSSTVNTFMRDIRIVVDGKTYTKKTITDGATNSVVFEFNKGDLIIDAGDRVTAEVQVDFKQLPEIYEGTTLSSSVDTTGIIADGADDLGTSQLSGAATSEIHTLRSKGISATPGSISSAVTSVDGAQNDYATYSVEVKVSAFGQDVYIPLNVADALTYRLENSNGAEIIASSTPVLSSNAKETGSYYRIADGETKSFTLEVTYQPGIAMTAARLQLLTLEYSNSETAPTQTWSATPASHYETQTKTIVN